MEQQPTVRSNRDIDKFIALSGEMEIDLQWGIQQMSDYLQELSVLEAGAKYSDLGIGQRRAESMPRILQSMSAGPRLVRDVQLQHSELTPMGSFAHLRLSGVMRGQSGASNRGVDQLVQDFYDAFQNENIAGILLEVNSGGGESMAGSMLQSVIAESPIPVVAFAHFMGSAAVRATAPADEIIASSEGAQVGSIGTFVTLNKWMATYYKNYYDDIYADASTNKNAEWRALLQGNTEPLKAGINRSNDQFVAEVKQYRNLKHDPDHTLSGAMFDAKEARRRGLVDGIGSFTYAMKRLEANAKHKTRS